MPEHKPECAGRHVAGGLGPGVELCLAVRTQVLVDVEVVLKLIAGDADPDARMPALANQRGAEDFAPADPLRDPRPANADQGGELGLGDDRKFFHVFQRSSLCH